MKSFLVLAIIALYSTAATAANAAFDSALDLLRQGNTSQAYGILESIPESDSSFADALVELQKIHYRKQEWSKFFAYAQFFRHRLLQGELPMRARMISLESLALAKHCHWGTSQSVIQWAMQEAGSTKADRAELEETRDYLRLHSSFPHSAMAREDKKQIGAFFSKTKAWKIQAKRLNNIPHPKHLRLRLASKCN